MSWKFFLLSFILYSASALKTEKRNVLKGASDELEVANNSPAVTKNHDGEYIFTSSDPGSDKHGDDKKVKKKKRVVAKRYVKRCNAKKDSVLESSKNTEEPVAQEADADVKTLETESVEKDKSGHESSDTQETNTKQENTKVDDQTNKATDGKKRIRVKRYVKKTKQEPSEHADNQETELASGSAVKNVISTETAEPWSGRKRAVMKTFNQKLSSDTQQLDIEYPPSGTSLLANTTSAIYVTATPVTKSFKQFKSIQTDVTVTVIFNCTSGIFIVNSPLGVNTSYTVDPDINGDCNVYAIVKDDPTFLPSSPISASIFIPIYFYGLPDGNFYTGEEIELYARPSNNATLTLVVSIVCPLVTKNITIITTIKPVVFFLTPGLIGNCTVISDTVIPYYKTFSPFEILISPAIFFLRPAPNTTYPAGADILVNLISTDRVPELNVTVELYCNDIFVKSLTQDIKSTYIFTQDDQVHGNCLLALADVDGYYTEQTIPIKVLQILSFVSPTPYQLIEPGTNYTILVDGNAPDGTVPILVTGRCSVGGGFTENVSIGIQQSVLMRSNLLGFCTLRATADNFADSTVPVLVYTPLTPEEISEEAKRLRLDGIIFEKTQCYFCD